MGKEKLKSLDGIKGIAIWFIVLYHTLGHFGSSYPGFMIPIKKYGGLFGNSFFFMISGFTICYVYSDIVLEHTINFKQFVGRRIRKLYPCYLLSTLVCICMFHVIYDERSMFTLTELMLNLVMLTSGWISDVCTFNYPCWFVSQLLLCYIIWYVITRFSKKEYVTYGYVIFLGIGYLLCSFPLSIPFCYSNDAIGFLNFFMGCLLYELYISYSHKFKRMISVVGIGIILVVMCIILKWGFEDFVDAPELLFTFTICPTCILSALEIRPLAYVLGNKVVSASIGNISMAVFFWHVPMAAFFITARNRFHFSLDANLYYILLLFSIFVFSHLVIRLREMANRELDAFWHKLSLYARTEE